MSQPKPLTGSDLTDREMLDLFETAVRNGCREGLIDDLRDDVLTRMTAGSLRLGLTGRKEMVRYGRKQDT